MRATDPTTVLLAGPYNPPRLRKGARAYCRFRKAHVIITGRSRGRIRWPLCLSAIVFGRGGFFVCKELIRVGALQEAGIDFGHPELTERWLAHWQDWTTPYRAWRDLTKACIDHMLEAFKKEASRQFRKSGDELTYANYFRSQGSMTRLLEAPLGGDIKRRVRAVLKV
jgi:hypothetical protein